jgi:hypothetical protein
MRHARIVMAPTRGPPDPLGMDLIALAVALASFVAIYVAIDLLERV